MSQSSPLSKLFGCLPMLLLFTLCSGFLYSCQQSARKKAQIDRDENERALTNEYAPNLLPAIDDCKEQLRNWNEVVQILSQTVRRAGKDPGKDKDIQEAKQVVAELQNVLDKLHSAKGDLIIAISKLEVKWHKGSDEEHLRRAQQRIARAIRESVKAVRIAESRQRQIDGDINPEDLAGKDSDQLAGTTEPSTDGGEMDAGTPPSESGSGEPVATAQGDSSNEPAVAPEAQIVRADTDVNPPGSDLKESPDVDNPPVAPVAPAEQVTSRAGLLLKLIPAGEFKMGADPGEIDAIVANFPKLPDSLQKRLRSELPGHQVRIQRAFYMSSTEVTVGQFRAFVNATSHVTLAEQNKQSKNWQRVGYKQNNNHPVTAVSWEDAVSFCNWLSRLDAATYRLPTEAEWEYACRAGSETPWFWGEADAGIEDYAWTKGNSSEVPQPVATRLPNKLGLYDMQGNVSEWCHDWYSAGYYATSQANNPLGPNGPVPTAITTRVVRGGSVLQSGSGYFRSTSRGALEPSSGLVGVGFRVVRETKPGGGN